MCYAIGTRSGREDDMDKEVRCTNCGWEGSYGELLGKTVYEDFGDVYYAVCPKCRRIDFDNGMLVEIGGEKNEH